MLPLALQLQSKPPRNIRSDQVVFPWHFEALKSAWRRSCSRAGLSDLRFRDLIQEAASWFFENGLNVMEVAAFKGHNSLRMLNKVYATRAEDLSLKLN